MPPNGAQKKPTLRRQAVAWAIKTPPDDPFASGPVNFLHSLHDERCRWEVGIGRSTDSMGPIQGCQSFAASRTSGNKSLTGRSALDMLPLSLLMKGKGIAAMVAPSCESSRDRGFCLRRARPLSDDRTPETSFVPAPISAVMAAASQVSMMASPSRDPGDGSMRLLELSSLDRETAISTRAPGDRPEGRGTVSREQLSGAPRHFVPRQLRRALPATAA